MFHLFGVSSQLVSFALTEHQVLCPHRHHKTQIQHRLLYLTSRTFKKTYTKLKIVTVRAVCPVQIPGPCYAIFIDLFSWTNIGSSEKGTELWLLVLQSTWKAHTDATHTHTSSWQLFLFLRVVFGTFFLSGMLDVRDDTGVSSLSPLICRHINIFNGQINVSTSNDQ